MEDNFESKKNARAGAYTALVCGLLLIIFFFVRWSLPPIPEPPVEEGMEVNLGSSDMGMGTDQPFEPGSPAPAAQQAYTPPAPTPVHEEVSKETPDDIEKDAPEIKKPTITKPDAPKVTEKDVVKSKPVAKPKIETPPAPTPPKPKAVFKGATGTGTGGNEADNYKKGGNQGIAGGQGDQGRPGGNPNSDNYKGGGTGSGIALLGNLKGRGIRYTPSFQDDFNENAKVAVDVKVDASGNVTSASYQPKGSSTSDAGMVDIAKRKAMQVKFAPGAEASGTIQFNFKLRN